MSYGVILWAACIVLPLLYVFAADASPRAKALIAGAAFASFWIPASWAITTILVQLAICLFVLFYLKAYRLDAPK